MNKTLETVIAANDGERRLACHRHALRQPLAVDAGGGQDKRGDDHETLAQQGWTRSRASAAKVDHHHAGEADRAAYGPMVAFYDPPEVARSHRWIERQRTGAEHLRGDRPGPLRERVQGLVQSLTFQL